MWYDQSQQKTCKYVTIVTVEQIDMQNYPDIVPISHFTQLHNCEMVASISNIFILISSLKGDKQLTELWR